MGDVIETVKANALTFHEQFQAVMEDADKAFDVLRIKVIVFRDYGRDGDGAMMESEFFTLPDQADAFSAYVNAIEAKGGGDIPENALEAIALALKSDWTTAPGKKRQVVLVFTDAPALPLGARKDCANYPADMPADLAALGAIWEGTDQEGAPNYNVKAGRLIVFAPNAEPWTEMQVWNRYWHTPSKAGDGCGDVEMTAVMDVLVGSID
jgi:hypothetical protein